MIFKDIFKTSDEDYDVEVFDQDGEIHIMGGKLSSFGIQMLGDKELDGFTIDFDTKKLHVFLKGA